MSFFPYPRAELNTQQKKNLVFNNFLFCHHLMHAREQASWRVWKEKFSIKIENDLRPFRQHLRRSCRMMTVVSSWNSWVTSHGRLEEEEESEWVCNIWKSGILISKKCMKNTLTIDKVHQPSFQRILPYLTFTIIIVVIIIINNEVYLCTNARNKWKKATRENQFSGYIRFHNEKLINGIAPIIETIRNCLFWENK